MPWQTLLKTLGSPEGNTLDRLVKAIGAALGLGPRKGVNHAAFTAAVVALSAKLSVADGVALKIEEETFERLFQFEEEDSQSVRWLFRLAAKDTAGFEAYARELARALADKPELERDILEALLHIASADGILHEGEDHYLETVSTIFGYDREQYKALRARFVKDVSDPYEVLGASRDFTNDALRQHYRSLVRQNHPDVLAGNGHSRELQEIAERKLASINAAWDVVSRERGLS